MSVAISAGPDPFDPSGALDWGRIELVAFDVDGTLYDQRRLRLRMMRDMGWHVLRTRSLDVPVVIGRYRHLREELGDAEQDRFEDELIRRTGLATNRDPYQVRAIAEEWMDRRPLPYLAACRYDGVARLFDGLRRHGKRIGVVSDYPARAKLAALGLEADVIVSATDPAVGILKPHPRGLLDLVARAGAEPATTLLIGDRVERDGEAARRAGAAVLILSARVRPGWRTFERFDDPVFAPMLATTSKATATATANAAITTTTAG